MAQYFVIILHFSTTSSILYLSLTPHAYKKSSNQVNLIDNHYIFLFIYNIF